MKKISELSLREKVGQMFIIRIKGKEIGPEELDIIKNYNIGGIILYRKNYDTYEELVHIVNEITKINKENDNIPLFISIDQEGGRVNRMPREIKKIAPAGNIAKNNNLAQIEESAEIIAKMLNESGINMNFAPVLDIQRFEDIHAIGNRCYGKNAEDVSKNGIAVMKKLSEGHIIPVIKHFPGHGSTTKDSHWFLPSIDKSLQDLEKEDIVPFKKAIEEGADAIMIGHLMIKELDNKPASLSEKVIKEYLINKLNYKGLIITDDLKMRGICLKYGFSRAAVKACKAGNDMIMLGMDYIIVKKAIKKMERKIKKGKISIEEVNNKVEKIINLKEKYEIRDEFTKGTNIEEINKKIEELNNMIEVKV